MSEGYNVYLGGHEYSSFSLGSDVDQVMPRSIESTIAFDQTSSGSTVTESVVNVTPALEIDEVQGATRLLRWRRSDFIEAVAQGQYLLVEGMVSQAVVNQPVAYTPSEAWPSLTTPLIVAATLGHVTVLQCLLKSGADPYGYDSANRLAISRAASQCRYYSVVILLESMKCGVPLGTDELKRLEKAVVDGQLDIVRRILVKEMGLCLNGHQENALPRSPAAAYCNRAVEILLVGFRDEIGPILEPAFEMCFHKALQRHLGIVELLVSSDNATFQAARIQDQLQYLVSHERFAAISMLARRWFVPGWWEQSPTRHLLRGCVSASQRASMYKDGDRRSLQQQGKSMENPLVQSLRVHLQKAPLRPDCFKEHPRWASGGK